MPLLGAHVSIAGGLHKAIERGDAMRCESIQIFTQNSRTWKIKPLQESEVRDFKQARASASTVRSVVAHNSYLLNLTTANPEARKKSIRYFIETMERCERLGIDALITHPGSHLGAGEALGIDLTAKSLDEVLTACSMYKTEILLENTAGQGDCIGHTFDQLKGIREKTKDPGRVGFCFDTQHAFAAGYDLRTKSGYQRTFKEWNQKLGLKSLRAFHLNDALKEFGCRVDRHANIGKGFLGKEAFRPLLNDPRFKTIPMCIETEPGDEDKKHRQDLKTLRSLLN